MAFSLGLILGLVAVAELFTGNALMGSWPPSTVFVCLAVWLNFSARDTTARILALLWPSTAFMQRGIEHSLANMFLLPLGAFAGAEIALTSAFDNLFWVTLGNIIGGAGGVALACRYAYLGAKKDGP